MSSIFTAELTAIKLALFNIHKTNHKLHIQFFDSKSALQSLSHKNLSNPITQDETRISVRNDCHKLRIRRKTGERMNIVTLTVKHQPAVMLWGSFAVGVPGHIRFLNYGETCNSAWYVKMLNQQVRWSAQSLFAEGEFYLQDDGAPCHRSKVVKNLINTQL